ncbi:MAG: hypothetical protein PHR11_04155, partial [Candidatus Omnitrophica bacterium]|nr:hypothetical protein [Candidatus Omnitrophota bacterium]
MAILRDKRGRVIISLLATLFVLAGLFLFVRQEPAQAVQVKKVQTGEIYVDANDISATVTIEPVDQTKTLIFLFVDPDYNTANYIRNQLFTAQFESDNSLVIDRAAASVGAYVRYYLVEFVDGVKVQRGISSFVPGVYNNPSYRIKDVSIPVPVDYNNSFATVLLRSNLASSTVDEMSQITASMVNETTMRLERMASNDATTTTVSIVWQVAEFNKDANIRTGEVFMDNYTTTATGTISPAIPAGKLDKSFLIYNSRTKYGINGQEGRYRFTGEIQNETLVRFERAYQSGLTNTEAYVRWYVIELEDESSLVQTGNLTWAAGLGENRTTLTNAVDQTRSFPVVGLSSSASATATYEDESVVYPSMDSVKGIAYDNGTNSIWATQYYNNSVVKYNATTGTWIATVGVGAGPNSICYDPSTRAVWTANYVGDSITKVNTTTYASTNLSVATGPKD